jgi:hypothetical protein
MNIGNVCFDILYKFVLKIVHSNKNSARHDHKCKLVLM